MLLEYCTLTNNWCIFINNRASIYSLARITQVHHDAQSCEQHYKDLIRKQGQINYHLTGGVQIFWGRGGGALVHYQGPDRTLFTFCHCRL